MNKCVFMGRLVRDVELKSSGSGIEFANFTLAVDRRVKKGEEKKADFVPFTVFGKTAVFVEKYFHQGDGMIVSGRMESSQYVDKETGKKRTSWSIVVEDVNFCLAPKKSGSTTASEPTPVDLPPEDLPF